MTLINVTKENFDSDIMKSDIPVIIDFWAEWCAPCKMMGPVFEELSREYEGKLKFAKFDTDGNHELIGQFSIQGIPALIVLKNSKEIDRIVGFAPKQILKDKIDKIMEKV